ncbi:MULTISPECIES: DUF2442 domain-containing protein [unclassified Thioalkalivibrio]|uniref:DUF2442 domain-containing protein n=1 Tax=Thioalkalivibrio sp. ALJ1 TaxID=1158144 RepID=UPI0009DF45A4
MPCIRPARDVSRALGEDKDTHDLLPEQLRTWKICGGGDGIHWVKLDEDLRTEGLLFGAPAPVR